MGPLPARPASYSYYSEQIKLFRSSGENKNIMYSIEPLIPGLTLSNKYSSKLYADARSWSNP